MQKIINHLKKFVQDRNWEQFHTSGELVRAINIEASELSELFLWGKTPEMEDLQDEIADVLIFTLLLAENHNIDIKRAIMSKMAKNAKKYPIHESKGDNTKYNRRVKKDSGS